jgi:hypothetical protein
VSWKPKQLLMEGSVQIFIPRRSSKKLDDIGGEARTQTSAVEKIPRPAIVELSRSEGCSACPPAEALLARFEEQRLVEGREIVSLKERVDYWNQ